MNHRKSIAEYLKTKKRLKILDYGGGFGTLAKEIANQAPLSKIDIFEPHALDYAYENIKDFSHINLIDYLKEKYYDVLVNTDVLEHVENPINLISTFNASLKKGGILIAHWNFSSCIKCHLPKHFHFKYTFEKIVPLLGFSKDEFEKIMNEKPKSHLDYPNEETIMKYLRAIGRLIKPFIKR